jgi:methylated-DNA-protein-cysteine methyltransferase related protein
VEAQGASLKEYQGYHKYHEYHGQGVDMFEEVYKIVKKVPRGKVVTYADIALKLGNRKLSRVVGNALHVNKNPQEVPCHRVVNKEGALAKSYAFGGASSQKKKLLSEGVKFADERKVDFAKCKFVFGSS